MSTGIVFQQMVIIFLLIITGCIVYKRGIVGAEVSKGISALVVNVCNPAILIRSSFDRDPQVTNDKLVLAVLGCVVLYGILLAASFILPRCLKVGEMWKNHYAMMCLFGNTGFIGIPLVSAVLGSQALIYVAVNNAFFNLFFYTYGIRLADKENGRFHWKSFLNVGNISILLTIILFFWQPTIPVVFSSTVNHIADTTTFLAMVVIGISLARTNLAEIFTNGKMYLFIALRFLLLPIGISLLLRLFIHDAMVYGVIVLMACVPVANLPLMRVEEVGGDGRVLSCGIILSTVLSIITIPLVVAFV
ncbi:AEC family transporter [Blautia schinkii]|nr:AEC family transporter [Blautia schinkii]